jgi:hypothetical protein
MKLWMLIHLHEEVEEAVAAGLPSLQLLPPHQ